jgi:hypothetical protein
VPRYSPKDVHITTNGLIITGIAEGTFVEASRNTEKREFQVGAKGEAIVNESADDTGTIKLTLQQTSPSNGILRDLFKQNIPFPASVVDYNPNTANVFGSECYIKNTPGKKNGDKADKNEWEILVVDYKEE